MERKELEVFSEASNYAIVRMPGRNFPGCVIQGDSLSILTNTAETVRDLAKSTGNQELIEEITELPAQLAGRLEHYKSVLQAHDMPLPFG